MKRLMLVWVMILCLMPVNTWAESMSAFTVGDFPYYVWDDWTETRHEDDEEAGVMGRVYHQRVNSEDSAVLMVFLQDTSVSGEDTEPIDFIMESLFGTMMSIGIHDLREMNPETVLIRGDGGLFVSVQEESLVMLLLEHDDQVVCFVLRDRDCSSDELLAMLLQILGVTKDEITIKAMYYSGIFTEPDPTGGILPLSELEGHRVVRLSELCGTEYVEAEIHRAPLNTDVPENCRSYGKNNIDENESVLILRDANGSERFFWYSKDYVFCDMDGEEIGYACFTYDCFVAQTQDDENRFFIVHISE